MLQRKALNLIAGVVAVTLMGCDASSVLLFDRQPEAGDEVPVKVNVPNSFTDDPTPVVTEIYPYAEPRHHDRKYEITGPPIAFKFPRHAHSGYQNWKGGPQSSIFLHIDRLTMKPWVSFLDETMLTPSKPVGYYNKHKYQPRDLDIQVLGNAHTITMTGKEKAWEKSRPGNNVGEACGFAIRDWRENYLYKGRPDEQIGDLTLPAGEYRGTALDKKMKSRLLFCAVGAKFCRITFGYEDRQVSYKLPRDLLCEHETYSKKVEAFLDQHRYYKKAPR